MPVERHSRGKLIIIIILAWRISLFPRGKWNFFSLNIYVNSVFTCTQTYTQVDDNKWYTENKLWESCIFWYFFLTNNFFLFTGGVQALRCPWSCLGANAWVHPRILGLDGVQSGTSVLAGKKKHFLWKSLWICVILESVLISFAKNYKILLLLLTVNRARELKMRSGFLLLLKCMCWAAWEGLIYCDWRGGEWFPLFYVHVLFKWGNRELVIHCSSNIVILFDFDVCFRIALTTFISQWTRFNSIWNTLGSTESQRVLFECNFLFYFIISAIVYWHNHW